MTFEEHENLISDCVKKLEDAMHAALAAGYSVTPTAIDPNRTNYDRFIYIEISKAI